MAGTERTTALDMEQALLDPGSVFATPEELLVHDDLSKQQKIELLRRWEYDASGLISARSKLELINSSLAPAQLNFARDHRLSFQWSRVAPGRDG